MIKLFLRFGLLWLVLKPIAAAAYGVEEIAIPAPDGALLRAIRISPPAAVARRPPIVALHGCSGLRGGADRPLSLPQRESDWAERLAALGHSVIFPDSFGSRGLGPACGRPDHPAAAAGVRLGDALAALLWATRQAEEPAGGAFLLGWSHGGSTVLWAVAHPLPPGILRAAIAFYPSCLPLLRAAPSWVSTVPLLILVGEADDWTPPAACLALAAHGGETVSLQLFAEARHGFDHPEAAVRLRLLPNGQWVSSGTNPAARAAAIAAVLHFLARH